MGIILAGVIQLFLNVITVNKSSRLYAESYRALDSKIEEIRNSSFDSISPSSFTVPSLPPGNQGTVSVSNVVDGSARTNIKEVEVTINWNFKTTNQVKSITYITRGGLKK